MLWGQFARKGSSRLSYGAGGALPGPRGLLFRVFRRSGAMESNLFFSIGAFSVFQSGASAAAL
eukprot:6723687-Pyramimonas_sp.AAC.1